MTEDVITEYKKRLDRLEGTPFFSKTSGNFQKLRELRHTVDEFAEQFVKMHLRLFAAEYSAGLIDELFKESKEKSSSTLSDIDTKFAEYERRIAGLDAVVKEQSGHIERLERSIVECENAVCAGVKRIRIFLAMAHARGASAEEIISKVGGEIGYMEMVFDKERLKIWKKEVEQLS